MSPAERPPAELRDRVTSRSMVRMSATRLAWIPTVSRDHDRLTTPSPGYLPVVGRNPTMPQNDAGTVIDPPVSVPRANGTLPSATAAALPPLEPPADSE